MEAPYNIRNYRRELCQRCKEPCQYQNDLVYQAEGDNECPIGRWKAWKYFVKAHKIKGAGDVVAVVAQPIAAAIDAAAALVGKKTNVKKCGACAKRKEMLNQLIPFRKGGS